MTDKNQQAAQRQARRADRERKAGKVRRSYWATPEQHEAIKALLADTQ